MENRKISNKGSATLFQNRLLERLTRTTFYFPVILFLLVGVATALYCYLSLKINVFIIVALFVAGLFAFTLVEYLIHRFVFHFNASTPGQELLKYKIHGVHHHFPKDKDRLAMPPFMSLTLAVLFFLLYKWLFGNYGIALFSGFVSGYSVYLIIHYAVHRYRQPRNFLSILWKHHSLHHYRSDNSAFSVSNPMWDYIFGTMPDKKSIQKGDKEKLPDSL
ncbi:MAG TPA: sterol desaturase family protein [Bacteroidia bacterium]|nr:sterol desaturase family protein [Bacteroidia bacterium]MBP7713992.1 sterol desaturase family protein [Bacteroidia bacterium]MBP8667735.1 sterol desaturase family protein [Bacteroidia bacterium]HOZ83361.1 sterol desaturase family protein [Bacteroidia bacterium]HOZ90642.1 sterol desaturase family protein [Bacteroidia bacterium]